MADVDDLTRDVKISAPYDDSVVSVVKLESVPVWFDLGWQKVAGEDYGLFESLNVAPKETSPAFEVKSTVNPVTPVINIDTTNGPGKTPPTS